MSPLFGRRRGGQAGDPAQQQEEARRDAESLSRLEQGRIPLAASERLEALASSQGDASGPAFSSDLSVAEFALLHSLGITPITLVMGSSIFHVGWQNVFYNQPTEFETVSHAYNECRRLALGRLLEEAQTARADAVVGVRIQQGGHDWAPGSVEFVAVGTAVALPEALRGPEPILTDLDGQQMWQLFASGIRPVGIVASTSVHYAPATAQTVQVMSGVFGSSWRNQELRDYTQGLYAARGKAMAELRRQAQAQGADGIVGVQMSQHLRGNRVQQFGGMDREDLIVTLHVIGTAVREDPTLETIAPAPRMALSLGSTPAGTRRPLRAASAGI